MGDLTLKPTLKPSEGVGSQLDLGGLAYLYEADVFVFNGDVGKQRLAQGGFEL